jgi:hypothetical protein
MTEVYPARAKTSPYKTKKSNRHIMNPLYDNRNLIPRTQQDYLSNVPKTVACIIVAKLTITERYSLSQASKSWKVFIIDLEKSKILNKMELIGNIFQSSIPSFNFHNTIKKNITSLNNLLNIKNEYGVFKEIITGNVNNLNVVDIKKFLRLTIDNQKFLFRSITCGKNLKSVDFTQ